MLPKKLEVGGPYGGFKTEIVDENGRSVATVITSRIENKTVVLDERGAAVLRELIRRWNAHEDLVKSLGNLLGIVASEIESCWCRDGFQCELCEARAVLAP